MPIAYVRPESGDYGAALFVRTHVEDEAHLVLRDLLGEAPKTYLNEGLHWSVYELHLASPVPPRRGADLRPQTVLRWLNERGWTVLPYKGAIELIDHSEG
jgi:hypothetical protein